MDIVNSLNYCVNKKGLHIYAWCLMSNYLHLVGRADDNLSTVIRDLKKITTKKIINRIQTEPESRSDWMLHQLRYAAKKDKRIKNYSLWQPTSHPIACFIGMTDKTVINICFGEGWLIMYDDKIMQDRKNLQTY